MVESGGFQFAQPLWLLALLAPLPVALWLFFSVRTSSSRRWQNYADAHLMPHLLGTRQGSARARWRGFAWWAVPWIIISLAMAGPRWDYTDVQLFSPGSNLVVVFDISRSMMVSDVSPRRVARARQELDDLLRQSHGARIGLVAFASVAHVIAPITEDTASLRRVVPLLSPDLVRLPGSRLGVALDRAAELLIAQPADDGRSVLLISDGDFDEPGIEDRVMALREQGIRLHVLAVGTENGGPVPLDDGYRFLTLNGRNVVSTLNEELLRALARAGDGEYRLASFRGSDTDAILAAVREGGSSRPVEEASARVWNERFYLPLLLLVLLVLPWFRRDRKAEAV